MSRGQGPVLENDSRQRRAPRFVYFVQAQTLGLIKIGVAINVVERMYDLKIGSPDQLVCLGVIRDENAKALESALHGQFGPDRSHGEWFRPSPELVTLIAERAVSIDEEKRRFVESLARRFASAEGEIAH